MEHISTVSALLPSSAPSFWMRSCLSPFAPSSSCLLLQRAPNSGNRPPSSRALLADIRLAAVVCPQHCRYCRIGLCSGPARQSLALCDRRGSPKHHLPWSPAPVHQLIPLRRHPLRPAHPNIGRGVQFPEHRPVSLRDCRAAQGPASTPGIHQSIQPAVRLVPPGECSDQWPSVLLVAAAALIDFVVARPTTLSRPADVGAWYVSTRGDCPQVPEQAGKAGDFAAW